MNFILAEEIFLLNEKQMNIKRKKYVNPPDTRQLNNIGISVNKRVSDYSLKTSIG